MKHFLKIVVMASLVIPIQAQVLFTGTTGGKNNGGVFAYATGQRMNGVDSTNNFGVVTYGANDHVDVIGGAGDMVVAGRHVPYGVTGLAIGLPTGRKLKFDMLLFNAVSIPVAHQNLAATAFGNSAVIASKTFCFGKKFNPTPYTGYSWLYAFGPQDRIMATPEVIRQIMFGVAIPFSKKTGVAVEYDQGRMKSLGVALNYNFVWKHAG